MNPYSVLGIAPGASLEEIKRAYQKLMNLYDPAQHAGDPMMQSYAKQKQEEIQYAYDQLLGSRSGDFAPESGSEFSESHSRQEQQNASPYRNFFYSNQGGRDYRQAASPCNGSSFFQICATYLCIDSCCECCCNC